MHKKAALNFATTFAMIIAILALALGFSSCKDKEAETPVPEAPPAPVPVAAPVDTEPVDTATDTGTGTEPELTPTEEPTQTGIGKNSVIGNYRCSIDGDFPVTPPPATCKIYEGSGGDLKIAPVGGTGITGNIAIRGNRLKLNGAFNLGVGNLTVAANLGRRNARLFKGKGTGTFAGATVKYTLTLKKL